MTSGSAAVADLLVQADRHERAGRHDQADGAYRTVFRLAAQRREVEPLAVAVRKQAQLRLQQGRIEEAEELAELSRALAHLADLVAQEARALNVVGMVAYFLHRFEDARRAYAGAIRLARDVGDDETLLHASRNLGAVLHLRGELEAARALYLEGVATALRVGDTRAAASVYGHLGKTACDLGEWMEAELHYQRAIELAERSGDQYVLAIVSAYMADPLLNLGEFDRAAAMLDRATAIATAGSYATVLIDADRLRGVLALRRGDVQAAEKHLTRAAEQAGGAGLASDRATALEDLGRLRERQGRPALAVLARREAMQIYDRLGAAASAERMRSLLGEPAA